MKINKIKENYENENKNSKNNYDINNGRNDDKNNDKSNVLSLYRILHQYSDKEHPLTMNEIRDYMSEVNHGCDRGSITRYMNQLENELGITIHKGKGAKASYYLEERLLDKEELKLIVDAVNASNFIDKSIADKMIRKLRSVRSVYDREEFEGYIQCVNVTKADNSRILENVRCIQDAIKKNKQITFDYMKWDGNKQLVKKNPDKTYTLNPWTLIWADDRYYLFGYDTKMTDSEYKDRNYRVDKLENIKITDVDRDGKNQFQGFNANTYVSQNMGMFTGKARTIKVRIPESLVGAFIDQFGKWIDIKEDNEYKAIDEYKIIDEYKNSTKPKDMEISTTENTEKYYIVKFTATASNVLLGWLIGLKNVQVLGPEDVVDDMRKLLGMNEEYY